MKQTALITGSTRGIGKAIAIRLAKEDYDIILHGSHESEALKSTEKELQKLGALVLTTFFDVSDKQAVRSSTEIILNKVASIDVLVNNAGIMADSTLINMSEEAWDNVLKTNLYGPFYIIRQFLPNMKAHGFGRIINMSSVGVRGAFGKSNYAAAKAGLIGMSKSLALEVAKYAITVNTICPGFIETDMSLSIPLKYREKLLSEIAIGRPGTPEEVASLVAYLASKESSYITGSVIDIHGGWL